MQIIVRSIRPFRSMISGRGCFRLDGFHQDEFGELVKGHTFIDPDNDNCVNWLEILEAGQRNRGSDLVVDHVRMKNRGQGIWNADSRPLLVDIIQR